MNDSILKMFKTYHITPLPGGGTNALYLLENSLKERCVLKVAMLSNKRAQTEEICLDLLRQTDFVPKLLSRRTIDGKLCLLMEYIAGKTHLSTLLENRENANMDHSLSLFRSLGVLLAKFHQQKITSRHLAHLDHQLNRNHSFIHRHLYERSSGILKKINSFRLNMSVLVHGDFGYHNVIRDLNGRDILIDWELAGTGDPRLDIGSLLFWTHLHFPNEAFDFCHAFMDGYQSIENLECTQEIIHPFVILQIWRIIDMVTEDFPDHVKKEWNRRLSWALDKVFI